MLNKFKEMYYNKIVLSCSNDEEIAKAMTIIEKHDAKILGKLNPMRKLCIKVCVPKFYRGLIKENLVVRGKNLSEVTQIASEFIEATNGFVINKQSFVEF